MIKKEALKEKASRGLSSLIIKNVFKTSISKIMSFNKFI